MKRLPLRKSLIVLLALGALAPVLGGCVVYDERAYRREPPPVYYVPGHWDREGFWVPGRYR